MTAGFSQAFASTPAINSVACHDERRDALRSPMPVHARRDGAATLHTCLRVTQAMASHAAKRGDFIYLHALVKNGIFHEAPCKDSMPCQRTDVSAKMGFCQRYRRLDISGRPCQEGRGEAKMQKSLPARRIDGRLRRGNMRFPSGHH